MLVIFYIGPHAIPLDRSLLICNNSYVTYVMYKVLKRGICYAAKNKSDKRNDFKENGVLTRALSFCHFATEVVLTNCGSYPRIAVERR